MDKYEAIKLKNQTCFSLYALSREIIKMYKPFLDQYELTYTQYIAMLVIWEEEKISFKELSCKLFLDSGTLTPVIKKLVSMDLVYKYRSVKDDRLVIVEITEKARSMKEEILSVPYNMSLLCQESVPHLQTIKEHIDHVLKELKKQQ